METPGILYEDNHLLVLNKPPGWLVQADKTGDRTLTDWGKAYLKEKYSKPGAVFLHPVHRIDRPVSGAVLFARTDKALSRLTVLFKNKGVEKEYLALVLKPPAQSSGECRHYLVKDSQRNVVKAYAKPVQDGKESITRYENLGPAGTYTLLRIHPLTGRPHQIRCQLAAIGCTIAGDLKYGAELPLPDASIGLHCYRMNWIHPVRHEPMEVMAPWPLKPWWETVKI